MFTRSQVRRVPVIASGGAGAVRDFPPAVAAGADAVLAASVFHDGILTIGEVKAELVAAGAIVRYDPSLSERGGPGPLSERSESK